MIQADVVTPPHILWQC